MSRLCLLFFLAFTAPLPSCNDPSEQPETGPEAAGYVSVTKVSDGDTFWVDDGSEKGLKVRLIGIDAPESHRSERKEVQPFGKEAADYLRQLLGNERVRLEYDVEETDKYGRTLAYAFLDDGTFINLHLIEQGYAKAFTVPPNVEHARAFSRAEKEARSSARGLWAVEESVQNN